MPGPLEGIKVVELGVWIAGPAAGGVLADWGADVVKIEPPEGDPARLFGKMLGDDLPYNPVFELDNRGKRSVVLDLSTDGRSRRGARTARRRRRLRHQRPAAARWRASASTTRRCWPATRASSTATSPGSAARDPRPTRRRSTSPPSGRGPASPTS